MTGNSWLPDHHAATGDGLSLTGVPSARMMAARHAILQDMPSSLPDGGEEEEEVVVRPTNGSLSMRATSNNILAEKFLHSHVNRSYTNTYSSCGSFKLPSVIGETIKTLKVIVYRQCSTGFLLGHLRMRWRAQIELPEN